MRGESVACSLALIGVCSGGPTRRAWPIGYQLIRERAEYYLAATDEGYIGAVLTNSLCTQTLLEQHSTAVIYEERPTSSGRGLYYSNMVSLVCFGSPDPALPSTPP